MGSILEKTRGQKSRATVPLSWKHPYLPYQKGCLGNPTFFRIYEQLNHVRVHLGCRLFIVILSIVQIPDHQEVLMYLDVPTFHLKRAR
jgi:hypothetical protein